MPGNDQGGAGRERKGKDVSAAPSYPALIELLPPFYRARNKPCAYASSLVNKPRNKHSLALVSLVHANRLKNFPRPSNICPTSKRRSPKISRVSLKVGRSESVVRTCDNSAHLSSPPLPVFIKPGVVRRQIGGGEVKEKNEAKRQAKVSKGGNCGWTDEPP